MLVWWIAAAAGTLLAGVAALVCWRSPKAQRKIRSARKRMNRKVGQVTRSAWQAHKAERDRTARGQRRLRRKAEPHRLTWGHRRTADDPTLGRRAGRAAGRGARAAGRRGRDAGRRIVDRVRLARMNRRPKPKKRTVRELVTTTVANGPGAAVKASVRARVSRAVAHQCEATTVRNRRCENTAMIGSDGHPLPFCWVHRNIPASSLEDERRGRAAS